MSGAKAESEALIAQFVFERLLNQDSQGRRIILLGTIHSKPGLLLIERAAFSTSSTHLRTLLTTLRGVQNLGDNDVYKWYLANISHPPSATSEDIPHDLKLNLIYPCTPKHVAKYTPQIQRYVTETPAIYRELVRPYIESQATEARLQWVYNILAGVTEAEDVLYRSWEHDGLPKDDAAGFLLLPDLNWDRKTMSGLHLLALVVRRDKRSVRDLGKGDVEWLRGMVARLESAVEGLYGKEGSNRAEGGDVVERDQVKFYLHYQPTYYHMHVHVVATALDATGTQAVGKAMDLRNVISILQNLPEDKSMVDLDISYTVGEGSELWEKVWGPLKQGIEPMPV